MNSATVVALVGIMLAAGRSLPAGVAARRAVAARRVLGLGSQTTAARCSSLGIRTLSSESTPGTVAGARAAASAGGLRLILCLSLRVSMPRVHASFLNCIAKTLRLSSEFVTSARSQTR